MSEKELIPLRCPYCGSSLWSTVVDEFGQIEIECFKSGCQATWTSDGTPLTGPREAS